MCGIAGVLSPEKNVSPEVLKKMAASLAHRGPDGEAVWTNADGAVGFAHRRLSILDLSDDGRQPMHSADSRFTIVFNGEIYNYLEIREQLEKKGCRFRSRCDTEVLLAAFQEKGEQCLDELDGMFAFAVWDEREKTLFAARDRVGLKPFYYAQTGKNFVFASEIKAVLASRLIDAELDPEGLNQFLTFLWTVPPHTLFKNIFQLPPAHFLVWKAGEVTVREWWDLDFSLEEKNADERVWSERVLETLERVVRMEMISDVPLGAFLSGGVDSSSIVALMTRHSEKVSTYTTGISAEDLKFDIIPDDVQWSRKVAEILPVEYNETLLTPGVAELLPKLVYHMDAPVIDMAIPSYLISEQSRKKQKVMLSGMGGDEIFAGYPRQMAMQIAGLTDFVPTAVRRPLMTAIERTLPGGVPGRLTAPLRNAKKFARSAAMDFENRYLGFGTYFTDEMKARLYAKDLRGAMQDFDAYRYHKRYFEKCRTAAPLNRLLYVDFKTFMPALNLDTTDKTSMAANLEVRAPFLNKELVELSARIPADLKIRGLKRKYILKKAVESLLPKEIVWRKKAGFSAPVRSWLRGALRPLVEDFLSEETVRRRGLFDAREVRRTIDLNLSGREDYNLQVFQLLNLEIFMREFFDKSF